MPERYAAVVTQSAAVGAAALQGDAVRQSAERSRAAHRTRPHPGRREEEYLLLDARTGRPAPLSERVRAEAERRPALQAQDVQGELVQEQVEVATPICRELDEAAGHLLRLRHELATAAEVHGARLAAIGAAAWREQGGGIVSEDLRYQDINSLAPGLVREQLINGLHVHVAVPTPAHGVEVLNRLRPDLPLLLAMSANSPYWQGRDSGFASWRTVHYRRWPVAGPPPHFADEHAYRQCVQSLLGSRAIVDTGQLYWQARVSERYPTVEVRCADAQLRADDGVLLAGVVRALVMTALEDMRAGHDHPPVPTELLIAAVWSAARHGLDDDFFDVRCGRSHGSGTSSSRCSNGSNPRSPAVATANTSASSPSASSAKATAQPGSEVVRHAGFPALVEFVSAEITATWP